MKENSPVDKDQKVIKIENWEHEMRSEIWEAFAPFNMYGMGDYIPGAIKQVIRIVYKYADKAKGRKGFGEGIKKRSEEVKE